MVKDNLLSLPPTSVTSFLLKVAVYEEKLQILDSIFAEEDSVNSLMQDEKTLLEQMKILSEGIRRGEKKFSFEFLSEISNRWFMIKAEYTDTLVDIKYPIFELLVTDITYVKHLKKKEHTKSMESTYWLNKMLCKMSKDRPDEHDYDELTGLYREQRFYYEVKKTLNNDDNKNYAMIAFDVDSFCVYNDLYNESVANQVLCHIGKVLKDLKAEDKIYSRYCADRFTLFLSYEEHAEILRVIEEIRTKCLTVAPLEGEVKLSFGICQIAETNTPVRLLCDWARMAEETVKGLSMQYYAFYNGEYRNHIVERKRIENEMTAALEQGQFVMYLQPKYNLETDSVIGAEALVRWKHPNKGLVPPDTFIPIFEKNGFIIKLDEFIWEEACKQISKWRDEGKEIPISVNISRLHTYDTDFVEKLMRLIDRYQIPVHLLELEFTESMFVEDEQTLLSLMHRLKEQGFTLLMDDFGSGYSSLNMLKNVPIDIIKLDRAFFQDIQINTRGKVIIESSIKMIHDLNLDVTAEGIEEKEHIEFLNKCNCNTGQGYFYAKPMEVGEFEQICLK